MNLTEHSGRGVDDLFTDVCLVGKLMVLKCFHRAERLGRCSFANPNLINKNIFFLCVYIC